MKKLFIIFGFLLAVLILWIVFFNLDISNGYNYKVQVQILKEKVQESNYNDAYAFLVDFSIPSGKKRLFLYNLKTGEIDKSFMVAHGEGCGQENGSPRSFSNTPNSLCSSEGMAVIGERAYSQYGINVKYWLEGLDDSNNNMRRRVVVIHSWKGIPPYSIYPLKIVQSQGCFTVANNALSYIDNFISQQQNKRILIYAFK
jgi:hypothetical protein